ncbi:thiol:disulfide interchange protein DsbB [Orbus hercynius]|uniref:Disulfide bond formation protein B n=1 Tax=Orbus hercynius TaxID=593135 RepID=A0A495RIS2_9GAMM|nr:disulfide bond formation protein DsbB [Orbus hercynius]RKS87174.1 thiol:disulfide interchange protein DsbB [Orbus hercynius]
MLNLLSQYSQSRVSWFLLLFATLAFEATALYFQHGLGLAPCTLCIYQRMCLLGILLASVIGLLAPKRLIFRVIALLIWLYSAFTGFNLAFQQARLQFAPSLSDSCTLNVDLPTWLPLNEWMPSIFNATGSCAEKAWAFLTIEMSQWMIIIFSCYLAVGIIILFAQCFAPTKRTTWRN